jgi:hypothetical protein
VLSSIGSQQADAAATIQHGIDSLAIDENGHAQLPLPVTWIVTVDRGPAMTLTGQWLPTDLQSS